MIRSWDTEHEPGDDLVKLKPLTCVSWADETGAGLFHARDPAAKRFVAETLTHHVSVGANIAHDIAEACFEWPELIPLAWQAFADGRARCLIQCERLISIADGMDPEAGPNNLDDLCQKYGYGALDKDPSIRMSYGPLRDVPLSEWSEAHRIYPIHDARGGLRVALEQPQPTDWENASQADWLCNLMGVWGFRTDLNRVRKLKTHYERQRAEAFRILTAGTPLRKLRKGDVPWADVELLAAPLIRPNGREWSRNTKVAQARMAATGATRMTPGGVLTLDKQACRDSGDPILETYAEYSSLNKRLSTEMVALSLGEIHCWFKPVMTNNQTSCSTPWNAQNPPTSSISYRLPDGSWAKPPGERECVVPRPGCCFIDADYNLFQLRTFSQVCLEIVGQSTMADYLNEGKNLHSGFAARIMGIPVEQFDKKKFARMYDVAKRCNFGFGADMGEKRFLITCKKEGVIVTPQEFWKFKNEWKQMFPESRLYFSYIQSLGEGAQITELFTGRKRGNCSYPDAANGYFSALAASAAKAAWFQLARECYDPSQNSILFGDRPINFIHDQFLIETPDNDTAHDHAMRVKEIMETVTRPFLPDVPATTDPCLASCWSKKADAVFDKNKRLLVWSPSEAA